MTRSLSIAALLALLSLAVLSSPMPTSPVRRSVLEKRLEDGVDCLSTAVDVPVDMVFCVGSDGYALYCEDCNNASSSDGTSCYVSQGDTGNLGTQVACPMDSVPEHMPDGTSTAAELVEAGLLSFCKSAVGGGQVALFGKLGTCLGYALLSNNGDPAAANKAGMIGLCDILSVATCSYFLTTDGYLDPTECTESEENPGLCSFAGPG